jgi:hypothetical protein
MKTETDYTAQLQAIGFTLQIESGPTGEVHDNDWPCIAYRVRLEYKGKPIHTSPYSMGVGHVKTKVTTCGTDFSRTLSMNEHSLLLAWQFKPHANFTDKALWASVAAKLAKLQKVVPSLADVMHSLLSDGSPFFDAESFEDWAGNLGYDPDSRKAESIYRECDRTGRAMQGALGAEMVAKLREIFSQY